MFDLFNALLDLLLPDQCLFCHKTLKRGEKSLCLVCQSKLPRIRGEKPDNEAEHRVFGKFPFEHGTSFCYYRKESDFSKLIISAKYHEKPWVNYNLARLFAAELPGSGWPFDIDCVMPVPVHVFRRIIRGYNQAAPIAKALSNVWKIRFDEQSLRKKSYTRSQVSNSANQRLSAVEGTFELKNPERFKGLHVLIVDDVLTTGATLDACAQLLVSAGARVSFLTLGLSDS